MILAKTPRNSGKKWTPSDEAKLRKLVEQNTPTSLIAHLLGRSEGAVYQHASEIDVTLRVSSESSISGEALVSADELKRPSQWDRERDERFAVIDRMRKAFKDVSPEEIEREAARSVAAARERRRQRTAEAAARTA